MLVEFRGQLAQGDSYYSNWEPTPFNLFNIKNMNKPNSKNNSEAENISMEDEEEEKQSLGQKRYWTRIQLFEIYSQSYFAFI